MRLGQLVSAGLTRGTPPSGEGLGPRHTCFFVFLVLAGVFGGSAFRFRRRLGTLALLLGGRRPEPPPPSGGGGAPAPATVVDITAEETSRVSYSVQQS